MIHRKILSLDLALDGLSDPYTSKDIPWPSPLRPPPGRFVISCSVDGVTNFQFMGRTVFGDVLTRITDNWPDTPCSKLYLYGPSGVGKSHVLAAVVLYLVQQGNRVVYIPDCHAALENPFRCIRDALLFAFHGDQDGWRAISQATKMDDLLAVVEAQPTYSLYLIVDQYNALDIEGDKEDHGNDTKKNLFEALTRIGYDQKYIFSASAGMRSDRYTDKKQTGTVVIKFYAGMTKVCPHFFELPCLTRSRMRQRPGSSTTHPGSQENTASLSRT